MVERMVDTTAVWWVGLKVVRLAVPSVVRKVEWMVDARAGLTGRNSVAMKAEEMVVTKVVHSG